MDPAQHPMASAFLKTPAEMEKVAASQIGVSACGPTAILNILAALDFPALPTPQNLLETVPARLRDYDTPSLARYLLSRVRAGTTHEDLVAGVDKVSQGRVVGKFFVVSPHEDPAKFSSWLAEAFKHRLALLFTENLFLIGNDAWHHQMAFGIEGDRLFLTNPLKSEKAAKVLVPEDHVLSRRVEKEDLEELAKPRWATFDVLEQICGIFVGEDKLPTRYKGLTIPWGGLAGVTAFARVDNQKGLDWLGRYKATPVFLPFYERSVDVVKLRLD